MLGPGRLVGEYRLEELLGEGAAGVVFRAGAPDGATVAVKVLRPERASDDILRARFRREARLAREIESRHVAPILELGERDDVAYVVLPFYAGGSLATRLRTDGRLTLDETVELAAQLGRGLDALHVRGILHRDVKPSNVLLDRDGTAALSDFGLARTAESTRLTEEGQVVGTPHYLAPELIDGGDATRASDVYALGCVLYECLVGAPPFAGRGIVEIGFAHLVEPPADPRKLRPELPSDVGAAVLSALAKDPTDRPTTATAFARLLHVARTSSPARSGGE
jgi:serine/threonine protein kinase